jgi:hypothetical protein
MRARNGRALRRLLGRQGSAGQMSEERSVPERRADDQNEPGAPTTRQGSGDPWSDVMERPAGPDAESMSPDPPVDPTPPALPPDDKKRW